MEHEIKYTITTSNENNYGTIHCNLEKPIGAMCVFSITTLTTKCAIIVLEPFDYIEINNIKYHINKQYIDVNPITLCDVINTVIDGSDVFALTDECLRITFKSKINFVINDASYNVKQLIGAYNSTFPLTPINDEPEVYTYTCSSAGNYLSTPILYLVGNIGSSCYTTTDRLYNSQKILMRINNSFSANFPIIASNGEFQTLLNTNDLSDITFTLVDSNMHELHLLSPMYISAVSQTFDVPQFPLLLSEASDSSSASMVSG